MKRRAGVVRPTHRSRFRVAVFWLIGILSTLDLAGAAYLHALWNERHAGPAGVVRSQSVAAPSADSDRASPKVRITATR